MATYYVRQSGNDSNAGTSPGAAWRTVSKALGSSGIASGDTVYIGPGVYRELIIQVLMTSPTVETFIIGDVSGQFTGDAPGEVIITSVSLSWYTSSSNPVFDLQGKDFLTFVNLTIFPSSSSFAIDASTNTGSTNITFDSCFICSKNGAAITVGVPFGQAANWTIRDSYICTLGSANAVLFTQVTGSGSDWDINVQIFDCFIMSGGTGVSLSNSGTSANRGNGIDIKRCTFVCPVAFNTSATNTTNNPSTIEDCIHVAGGSNSVTAGGAGFIVDNGGNLFVGSLTNVTQHLSTRVSASGTPTAFLSLGHEWLWGAQPRRAFSPLLPAIFSRGVIGSDVTDLGGRARPEGSGDYVDGGTVTSATATTLTDSSKSWNSGEHTGRLVRIISGTGAGQVKMITTANTATTLTIGNQDGDWATIPSTDSVYVIYDGPLVTHGKATAGAASTLTDSGANWGTTKWVGYTIEILSGTGAGQTATIVSHSSAVLTRSGSWSTIPDSTSIYAIYWPGSSLTAPGAHPGAFEYHDSAQKETAVTDAGSVGITISGPGSHDFIIPVDAASTTITVKARYDSNHGTTNKPQAILLANGEIGVSTETETMTSSADTWETLTFSAFTPSAKGVVTVRLVSRSATPYGRAYFDTFTVT